MLFKFYRVEKVPNIPLILHL